MEKLKMSMSAADYYALIAHDWIGGSPNETDEQIAVQNKYLAERSDAELAKEVIGDWEHFQFTEEDSGPHLRRAFAELRRKRGLEPRPGAVQLDAERKHKFVFVSKVEVDLIAGAAFYYRIGTEDDRTAIGKSLRTENLLSLKHCYPTQDWAAEQAELDAYVFANPGKTRLKKIMEAVARYGYQSCRHPGWQASKAREICDGLVRIGSKLAAEQQLALAAERRQSTIH